MALSALFGLSVSRLATSSGLVEVVGPIVQMQETPTAVTHPSPALGRHNDEILAELGFSATEIAALRPRGAIV